MLQSFEITRVYGPKTNLKFSTLKPTLIGLVNGVKFYEHPTLGDEAPLISVVDGQWVQSIFWELPDPFELIDGRAVA
jgi:hypothetical protein